MSINQRIIEIRKHLGKTQEVLAESFSMTRNNLAKIETGKSNPSLDMLTICHNRYGIDLNWLICGTGKIKRDISSNILEDPKVSYGNENGWKEAAKAKDEIIEMQKAEIARLHKKCEENGPKQTTE